MSNLRNYYAKNPEWEKRRFELIKGFAFAQYQFSSTKHGTAASVGLPSSISKLCKQADLVLAAINEDIKNLLDHE